MAKEIYVVKFLMKIVSYSCNTKDLPYVDELTIVSVVSRLILGSGDHCAQ